MPALKLRSEFQTPHMRATAIELSNGENTGWTQRKDSSELLEITYPTADVRRALEAVSLSTTGRPIVMMGQRGSGKSHIMALVHHAFVSPDVVEAWARSWGQKISAEKLAALKLQRGFMPISDTLSNQERPLLWDVIFAKHPKGEYYRGKFESSGNLIPAKSLLQDMFAEQQTALILDELQTWYDGLHDEPGSEGRKRLSWAFNFVQILSELAVDRPDLLCLVVSVRDNTTNAFQQIHRKGPLVIDFKGETSREDRKRLVLHRLFQNRENISAAEIQQATHDYASERVRLLFPDKTPTDQSRLRDEVMACWPFSPELLALLEDHLLMAAAAQDSRDFIRMLAEVFRVRGQTTPIITPADFCVDDDDCGVTTLVDSFATTADQERLREKAIHNLAKIREANIEAPHAREVISSIWVRSLSATQDSGGTRSEIQLDITRGSPVDDNAFTAELSEIVENSFNVHEVGTHEKRFCFKLPENPESKLKAWARNDNAFAPQTATASGLLPVRRDQEYLKQVLNYLLKTPDGTNEPPSQPVVLDPNWETAPWANLLQPDQPAGWTERGKPVLIVLPIAPQSPNETLGPWLVEHVPQNRNMVRFLLPTAESANFYDDRNLLITARCALLAKEWMQSGSAQEKSQYEKLHRKYEAALKTDLKQRFDRYSLLATWDFQTPTNCTFHVETHDSAGSDIPAAVEKHVVKNHFAPEDFEPFIVQAAVRNDTLGQVLALLREPPLPGQPVMPYIGDQNTYEQVIKLVARDKIALNKGGRWYHKEPGESVEAAEGRLKQAAYSNCDRKVLFAVQLGERSQVGGGGVAATLPTPATQPVSAPGGTLPVGTSPQPPIPWPSPSPPQPPSLVQESPTPVPAQPVIRRSMGAKTGINLLGDLEKWALPDAHTVTQATLTIGNVSVKQLRELCTKLPPKIQAELQITFPPEGGTTT
jgi:hypothetical protein